MARIVVGIDGSDGSRKALQWAAEEAVRWDATLDVVHAWRAPEVIPYSLAASAVLDPTEYENAGRELLDEVVDGLHVAPPKLERLLVQGSASAALVDAATGADLVVVGSRGRGGFTGLLLGSVSQQVVHHAPCPVVVIPPE